MASPQSVADLLGEDVLAEMPDRGIFVQPNLQIGDGLAGPENDQPLQIFRDDRPLAVDELGMGHLGKLARHRAGRSVPLNYHYGAWFDTSLPGLPLGHGQHPSVLDPGQSVLLHDGVPGPEIVRNPRTVVYTATPEVGWEGW